MAVDYEAAWDDLQALLLTREGWGTRTVIAEMADLRVKHRIGESDASRALRLAAQSANGVRLVEPPVRAPDGGTNEDPRRIADGHHDRSQAVGRASG